MVVEITNGVPKAEDSRAVHSITFSRSDSIAQLAGALAKAQSVMHGAKKDSANPFFKSMYADLASCWDVWRPAGPPNELAIIQTPKTVEGGIEIETLLVHSSGEWISNLLWLPVAKGDAQGIGSAITYGRRYGFAAITGIAPEDDDGNAAAHGMQKQQQNGKHESKPDNKAIDKLRIAAKVGTFELEQAWKSLTTDERKACQSELPALKELAGAAGA